MVVAVVFGAALGACADAFVADAPRPTPSVEGDSAPPSRDHGSSNMVNVVE